MQTYNSFIALLFTSVSLANGECWPWQEICEFNLNVAFKQTMVDQNNVLVKLNNGSLYRYDANDTQLSQSIPVSDVTTADGFYLPNLVIHINGQMPGPTISVYEGQTVKVTVNNELHGHAISVHWHGLTQRNTPWMDGPGYINQCPINPGTSFVYTFLAESPGTYFYHNHVGGLGTVGLHGPLIIKERKPSLAYDIEHVVMISEYNHAYSAEMQQAKSSYGDYTTGKRLRNPAIDGQRFSGIVFDTGLINGRGRYIDDNGIPNDAPLTVFDVSPGERYRFRVIGTGYGFPFRVSVDNHTLLIVAMDAWDIEPVEVESFILNNGERVDFLLHANQSPDNYFFRAKTLEVNPHHKAEAIVRYTGAKSTIPTSDRRQCTADYICVIANCMFPEYPGEKYSKCLDLSNINSKADISAVGSEEPDSKVKEFFLNFGFTNGPSINGRAFVLPDVSALTQPKEVTSLCRPEDCNPRCSCTNSIAIDKGDIVQLILLSLGNAKGGVHPVHLHGHTFQVLKIGQYNNNKTTRHFESENTDIKCQSSSCSDSVWADASWKGNSIPDLKLRKPVYKDTININAGTYAVVRFKADNPGMWLLHCHMEFHMLGGMALIINESFPDIPPPPPGFPICGNFPPPDGVNRAVCKMTDNTTTVREKEGYWQPTQSNPSNVEEKEEVITAEKFWTAVGILAGIAAVEMLMVVVICFRQLKVSSQNIPKKDLNLSVNSHL